MKIVLHSLRFGIFPASAIRLAHILEKRSGYLRRRQRGVHQPGRQSTLDHEIELSGRRLLDNHDTACGVNLPYSKGPVRAAPG